MPWYSVFVLVGVAIIFTIVVGILERRRFRQFYAERPCAGIRWHRAFPDVAHDEIRAYLQLFGEAFYLPRSYRSLLRPDDRILEVYGARYLPHFNLDDLGELESFVEAFHVRYGIDLMEHNREGITVGDVFGLTLK